MDKGYLKLHRKSFVHKFWTKSRVFSEFEAWIDLLQSARYDGTEHIEYIVGREIRYGRGQCPASIRFLAKRWNWGEKKVRSFLVELKRDKSITIDDSQGMNVITICKYDKYNPLRETESTAKDTDKDTSFVLILKELQELKTQVGTQQKTQQGHSKGTNSNKENNINNNIYGESSNSPPDLSFEKVWEMYERKGNKQTSLTRWRNLTKKEKTLAFENIPLYVQTTPEKQYRKNFESYINQKVWNDELLTSESNEQTIPKTKLNIFRATAE